MGWGNALAAAVGGYLKGTNIVEDQQDRKDEKEWRDERRARVRKDEAKQDSLDRDLQSAGATVGVTEGAGGMVKPDTMDNRDVGLPENAALPNQGLQQGGFSVAGKAFADRAAADTAAAAENSPDAVNGRVAGAYRRAGQFDKAMAMEAGGRTAELQKMQLADAQWKRDLGGAMRNGHAGLASLATSSEAGPMKGMNVQAVVSEDGKTVTYSAVDKDGNVAPIPGLPQFSNDQNGLVQAAYMLDRTVDPSARMAHLDQQQQRAQAQANSDRAFNQQASQFNQSFGLQSRSADRQDKLAEVQIKTQDLAYQEALRGAKIPQAVKLQVDGLRKEQDTISSAIAKAQADGSWQPDAPGAKALLERQAIVNAQIGKHLQPYMKEAAATDPFNLKPQGRNAGANGGQGGGSGRGSVPASYKDPVWDSAESEASKKTGVPTEVMRIIRTVGERSNSNQVSSAGAQGVYQFIPSSREAFKKKYGVDAYSTDPNEQALAAAYHLKESYDRTGSWDKAMAGFNGGVSAEKGTNGTAENRNYSQRTSSALAATQGAADPMEALYKRQVAEMNRGTRVEFSPDVSNWRKTKDAEASKDKERAAKDEERRFNAAQTAFLQREKLDAEKKSRELIATSK